LGGKFTKFYITIVGSRFHACGAATENAFSPNFRRVLDDIIAVRCTPKDKAASESNGTEPRLMMMMMMIMMMIKSCCYSDTAEVHLRDSRPSIAA